MKRLYKNDAREVSTLIHNNELFITEAARTSNKSRVRRAVQNSNNFFINYIYVETLQAENDMNNDYKQFNSY